MQMAHTNTERNQKKYRKRRKREINIHMNVSICLRAEKKRIYYVYSYTPFHINTFQIEYSKNNLAHSQKQLKTLHTEREGKKK